MAKRMMVDFKREGYPQFLAEEENATAKPCAIGIGWVNDDTLATIEKCGIECTGPRGEPLDHPSGHA